MAETKSVITESKPVVVFDPFIRYIVTIIVSLLLAQIVCVFGIVANVINIKLFRKLGYQDGVNVTLTALAINDLGALLSELAFLNSGNPFISELDVVVSKVATGMISGYSQEYFVRVSSAVTTFAALERCLCVTRPLKVKSMITTKKAVMVNLCLFLIYLAYLYVQFSYVYMDWTFLPERNRTVFMVFFTKMRTVMFPISYYVTEIIVPYLTFLILIVCSAILFVKLKSKSKWRQSLSSSKDQLSSLTSKDRKTAMLFMTASIMCVVFLLPAHLLFTTAIFRRELALDGALSDLSLMISSITNFLKVLNSSLTIFIYYTMSTKYRNEFQLMVGRCRQWLGGQLEYTTSDI
uniref:G-protein coupled receptors family 1 profile domain-containing protein n=1 Tax=Biomphalaria glabrata TaxID=6526 RepID=A0A2C9LP14_BIOGL